MLREFVHYAADELPRLSEVAVDARVFGIAIAVSVLTTLVFAGLPVWRVGRLNIQSVLQESERLGMAAGYRFMKRALVVTEIALSLILLSGAALLLQTLWHLKNDHLGFNPEHVLTVSIPLKGTKLASTNRDSLVTELVDFVRRIPGTEDAAQTECSPLSAGPLTSTFARSDRPLPEAFHRGDGIHVCGAGPGYARASGIRVVRGRFFTDADFQHPNTLAVINETAARTYFPGEDPIGKLILRNPENQRWRTVIGVVSDAKNRGLDVPPAPEALINGITWPDATELQLIVGSIGDQHALESAITSKLRSLDSGVIANFEPLDQTITEMTSGPRFNSILLASFAAIAFLMAIVGVYGVLSFAVTQRTQEIGIRIALGAEPRRMLALVLSEGITLVFAGVIAGLSAVLLLTRYLKAMLYGVSATDPITLLAVSVVLLAAAVIAMYLPAHRAASVDPMVALRHN
jgi:putative ABC transport system permease protein